MLKDTLKFIWDAGAVHDIYKDLADTRTILARRFALPEEDEYWRVNQSLSARPFFKPDDDVDAWSFKAVLRDKLLAKGWPVDEKNPAHYALRDLVGSLFPDNYGESRYSTARFIGTFRNWNADNKAAAGYFLAHLDDLRDVAKEMAQLRESDITPAQRSVIIGRSHKYPVEPRGHEGTMF